MDARTSCLNMRHASQERPHRLHTYNSNIVQYHLCPQQAHSSCGQQCPSNLAVHSQRSRCTRAPVQLTKRRGATHNASSLVDPGSPTSDLGSAGDVYAEGAARLRAFLDVLPELGDQEAVLGGLLAGTPGLVVANPHQVRSALEALATALGVSLLAAVRLVSAVPAVWEVPPVEAAARVRSMAAELGVGVETAMELYGSQPGMWAVSHPTIVKDRLDTLATRLGLPLPDMVRLVGRQPLLWVVQPGHVDASLRDVEEGLGLQGGQAGELVVGVPPVLTLPRRLMKLSVQGLSATTGVAVPSLLALLCRSLGLVAVPEGLLAGALTDLAGDLGCAPEHVVELMRRQPTMLCAQYGTIQAALQTLETALQVDRATALKVLADQPTLMYDTSLDTLMGRLEGLADTFGLSGEEARALGVDAPALLGVAAATVRSAATVVGSATGGGLEEVLALARNDPGAFVMVTLQESLIEAWSARLDLPPDTVSELLRNQPGLLELTPTTVKARLESLAALFGAPAGLAAQLLLKHAALGAVPPNATITRAKNISMALRISMQTAANIIAKEPALLAVLATRGTELRGTPLVDEVSEVGSLYEYYTMEWLQRQMKELQPTRMTSFAGLDGG